MSTRDVFLKNLNAFFERYKTGGGNQSTLATSAGVRQGQISVWLKGGTLPGAENLPALAKALDISIEDFYRDPAESSENVHASVSAPIPLAARFNRLTKLCADPASLARLDQLLNVLERQKLSKPGGNGEESGGGVL